MIRTGELRECNRHEEFPKRILPNLCGSHSESSCSQHPLAHPHHSPTANDSQGAVTLNLKRSRLILIIPETMSTDSSSSGIMQKADQIAFHFYTKLFYTINQARATEEPHSQGKIDKWVRSTLSLPDYQVVIVHCTVQPRNTRFRPLHERSP